MTADNRSRRERAEEMFAAHAALLSTNFSVRSCAVDAMLSFAAAEVATARKEERARCAKVCRDRAVLRFIDHGTVEDDTGASYYEGNRADEYETRDEEDESCAEGIEKLEDA